MNDCLHELTGLGVVRAGHFLRSSGRHADWYVQCARLFERADTAAPYMQALSQALRGYGADVVMSAAIGGLLAGYEVARAMGLPHIYCERRDGAMTLRRGFELKKGSKVLLVEDEVTTGSSVREMMEIVRALGARTVAVGCVVDKSGGKLNVDVPLHALCAVEVHSYRESVCPLCARGEGLTRVL